MEGAQFEDIAKSLGTHATREVHAMDADRFDGLMHTLAAAGPRRRVLAAALAGALLTVLGGRGVGAADDKVSLCHRTNSDTTSIVVIEVSVNAVTDHLAHGDFRYTDCCLDGDCDGQPCINGACCAKVVDGACCDDVNDNCDGLD